MYAYEFHATPTDGYIKIPDEYAKKIGPKIRVILMADDAATIPPAPAKRSLSDLVGIFKACGDVDLRHERMERLKKHENLD